MESFVPAIGTIAVFTMIICVVWFGTRTARAAIQAQAELRHKLIDKFGSAQELSAFLETKGGREFLGGVGRRHGPNGMRSLGAGVILTVLGLALLETEAVHRHDSTPGVIVLALGIGFLILAGISHKMASKAAGDGSSDSQPNLLA